MPHWFKGNAGSRRPQPGKRSSHADLRDMISRPHVVEVLDILTQGPVAAATVRAQIRGNRRAFERALRALAAGAVVTAGDGGTWDNAPGRDRLYQLTDRGRQVVQELSRWPVWTAMLDTESEVLGNGLE